LALAAAGVAHAGATFQVPLDQARALALKAPATGVVIGNPSIAGVSLQNDRLLFVTGRSYGTTNLIVIGAGNRPVYEGTVTVVSSEGGGIVTVTRGLNTVRQSCTPVCRKTPDISDDPSAFDEVKKQIENHAASANE
jgi:hypothetical protein